MKLKLKHSFLFIIVILLVWACANRGQGPTGGPKDTTPPKVMKSNPLNGSLNCRKKQIEIVFDEMVSIEKSNENVIISPPQQKPPDVKAIGKNVVVNFNEELTDSTTYTINFGNGIVDLNEKNPLKNYLFSFSTGNQIDTLQISGTVINAEDNTPLSGIYVGIYPEQSDSVFFKKPFLRIGRTDEKGHFAISNMKKGKYKVFALDDANHDYFFQPGESVAMNDTVIVPSYRMQEMKDTIWKDSTHIDSVRTYIGAHYLPDNILLRLFKENKKRQYFVKYERKDPFVFSLFFNAPASKSPEIKPLNFNWEGKYLLQKNANNDSLTYWLTDSTLWKVDTLQLKMTYFKSDSLLQLVPATDTLSIALRKLRVGTKTRQNVKIRKEAYNFTNNISTPFDIYNALLFNFEAPLDIADVSKIKLSLKVDTIFKPLSFKWLPTDSTRLNFSIQYKWIPEKTYQLKIDSGAFISIYNRTSNKFKNEFKIHSLDDYSTIKLFLTNFDPKVVLQILDTKDIVVASKPALEKGTEFKYLKPGSYYIRMFTDLNGNGIWDTGDLLKRIQPEPVMYYPKKLTLKANWDFEETWDVTKIPILQQKPAELIKAALQRIKNK